MPIKKLSSSQQNGDVHIVAVFYRFGQFVRIGAFLIEINFYNVFELTVLIEQRFFHPGVLRHQLAHALANRSSLDLEHIQPADEIAMGRMKMNSNAHLLSLHT